jgi:glycosyltransferase involved in cell wall biosynthesis
MKILCVIDHFGSGGAQRQMVNLAMGLRERGHEVEFFVYFPGEDFFRLQVDQAGIAVHCVAKGQGFSLRVLLGLARIVRRGKYDGIISFLSSPNVYAELARLVAGRTVLVVSERSSHRGDTGKIGPWLRRNLHRLADFVVANSYSHADWLRRYPWLKGKVITVYNGYHIQPEGEEFHEQTPGAAELLVVGRVGPEKNAHRVIEALALFHRRHGFVPRISWAGKQDVSERGRDYLRQLDILLEANPEVKANWVWLGERNDIPNLLQQHYGLVHPSVYEGLPNVVCEALVAGRPVIVSDNCDNAVLVEEGARGFLCDPSDTSSVCAALEKLLSIERHEWRQLCMNARQYAEENLGTERMVSAYVKLLQGQRPDGA